MTIVAVPAIRDLGTVPNNNMDESTYNSTAETFASNMPPWGADVKAVADSAKTNAEHANGKAIESATSAQTAADRLADVNSAASGAFAAANYKGEWASLTGALALPATVTHQGRLWYLKSNLANVATQPPALGSAYWGEVSRNDFTVLPCPAGNTNAADRGMYRMTAASSALVLPAAPWHGMVVAAVNVSGTLTPKIVRNGKTICGDAEDYVLNVLGWQIVLQYDAASGDWLRVNGSTAFTPYSTTQPFNQINPWTAAQNFGAGFSYGDGRVIKNKSFILTAPSTASARAIVSHGLNASKVTSITGVIRGVGLYGVTSAVNDSSRANEVLGAFVDTASLYIETTTSSSSVYGRTVVINIEYEA